MRYIKEKDKKNIMLKDLYISPFLNLPPAGEGTQGSSCF
jgi:hypothetical protein